MLIPEEKVQTILQNLCTEAQLKKKIRAIVYRKDYADYLAVVGSSHYCDIREKLINDYVQHKHEDVKREIIYKLNNPTELDEFQKAEFGIEDDEIDEDTLSDQANKDGKGSVGSGNQDEKKKIAVDDDEKFDWLKD